MCGIFGWVSGRRIDAPHDLVRRALETMTHRGPDGDGVWSATSTDTRYQIAFGHTRLAIIDPAGGAQPFSSHDGRYVLTFNGEIYNYVELRAQLTAKGHHFTSNSDTEVVIETYRRFGQSGFAMLRGMFALALFDLAENKLVLARDAVGKKPLFVARLADGFVFASEIAALLVHPAVSPALDLGNVGSYIVQRYIDGPSTFFRDITKIPPGHTLTWQGGETSEARYHQPALAANGPAPTTLAQSVRALGEALDESVRIRMRSDAPFGLFLSGGLDSSVVLALMSRHSGRSIKTFSVCFDDSRFSEAVYARDVARAFSAQHEELVVTPRMFEDCWAECITRRGAPVSEASDLPIFLLSKAASSSVKMVLTGEGADELLAGYPKYLAEGYLPAYQRLIPSCVHHRLIAPLVSALPYRFRRLKILAQVAGERDIGTRGRFWFASADEETVRKLTGHKATCGWAEPGLSTQHLSALRSLQQRDFEHWLPDNLLERGDRMMMGGSIEGRMPFMDTELASVVATFPDRHLTGHRRGKLVLRKLAARLIAPSIINRPKVGFTVPVGEWFRSNLREPMRDLLQSKGSKVRTFLDGDAIDAIVRQHDEKRSDQSKLLWTLTNLEQFMRAYA